MIKWFTGNSCSGKSTISKRVQSMYKNCILLNGDVMRTCISRGLTLSKKDRIENNIRVAYLAKALHDQNFDIVIASIAPYQEGRDKVDKIIDVEWIYIEGGKVGIEYPYEIGNYKKFESIEKLRDEIWNENICSQ